MYICCDCDRTIATLRCLMCDKDLCHLCVFDHPTKKCSSYKIIPRINEIEDQVDDLESQISDLLDEKTELEKSSIVKQRNGD